MHYGIDSGWWIAMAVMMAAFWGGLIALAAWAAYSFLRNREIHDDPLEIARRRYASGQINEEQFERIRSNLTQR